MRRILILTAKIAASLFALTILGVIILLAVLFNYGPFSKKTSVSKTQADAVDRRPPTLGLLQSKSSSAKFKEVAADNNASSVNPKTGAHENFLVKTNYLLNTPVTMVNLCELDCDQLAGLLERQKDYWKGNYEQQEELKYDPAFQLAAVVIQATFGSRGKEIFSLIQQLQKDPISIKSLGLTQWVWRFDEILVDLKIRGKQRASEGDALIDRIDASAKSCAKIRWNEECKLIEAEISAWVAEGAFR